MRKIIPLFILPIFLFSKPIATDFLSLAKTSPIPLDYQSLKQIGFTNLNLDRIIQFIEDFRDVLEKESGAMPDVAKAIATLRNTIFNGQFSNEEKDELLAICDLFLGKMTRSESGFWPFSNSKNEPEFVLPEKMAAGFVCAFAGALICVIPGGQG